MESILQDQMDIKLIGVTILLFMNMGIISKVNNTD